MRRLSLDPLTIFEVSGPDLVDIAADHGFAEVALWANLPYPELPAPLLAPGSAPLSATLDRLKARSISVAGVECFNITEDFDCEAQRPALAVAARLGARAATTIFLNPIDPARALAKFKAFCGVAAEYGLNTSVEFLAISPIANSFGKAAELVEASKAPNARITLDALHFFRTGGTIDALARTDLSKVGYVQLCDGPMVAPADQLYEMGENRQIPGRGEFPLKAFLRYIPKDIAIGLEVPRRQDRDRGLPPREIVRICVAAAMELIDDADRA